MSVQRAPVRHISRDPILDAAIPVAAVSVELRDWKRTHRDLTDEHRIAALEYVTAIIRRDILLRSSSPEQQQAYADRLWRRFRDLYDELKHGEQEDFLRALGRL